MHETSRHAGNAPADVSVRTRRPRGPSCGRSADYAKLWSKAVGSGPPDTAQQRVDVPALLAAAVVEGTLYKLTRMAFDRGVRTAVARSTGSWPGESGQGE